MLAEQSSIIEKGQRKLRPTVLLPSRRTCNLAQAKATFSSRIRYDQWKFWIKRVVIWVLRTNSKMIFYFSLLSPFRGEHDYSAWQVVLLIVFIHKYFVWSNGWIQCSYWQINLRSESSTRSTLWMKLWTWNMKKVYRQAIGGPHVIRKTRKQTHSGVCYSVFFYFRYSWDSGPPDLPLPGPGCVCGVLGVPDLLAKTGQASAPPARGGHLCLSDR